MNYKKFLMIVEKPLIKTLIERVYESMGDEVNYDMDIALANNFVFDINDKLLVNKDNFETMNQHPVLRLSNQQVNEYFRIIKISGERDEHIMKLIASNHYDAIINACDIDEYGDLMFAYTIESLGLGEYPTLRFNETCLTDAYLANELLRLNNQ